MDDLRFLLVGRALQRVKAKVVIVGRDTWDWQSIDGLAGSSVPAGSLVEWKQLLVGDRPTRVYEAWPWNEIDRIIPQANAAPKIGGSAELARDRDVHVVVYLGRDNICRGKSLNVGIGLFSTGFEQKHFETKMTKLDSERYSDWSSTNNANVVENIKQSVEGLVNHF